jgi:phosphate uptake regulator
LHDTLKLNDRELDAVTRDLGEKLVAGATVDSELVPSHVDLILVARALERIGDHASPRILSGVIKPLTFVIPTGQSKNPNFFGGAKGRNAAVAISLVFRLCAGIGW